MTVNGQLVARSAADDLRARLDEPQVAAALNTLLDHVDLLALVAVSFDGFFSRADVIADTLAEAVGDLRGASGGGPLAGVDVQGLLATASNLAAAKPAVDTALAALTDPRAMEVLTALTASVGAARYAPPAPTGVFGLLRALKDDDVARGLGFLLAVAKEFGHRLKTS